MSEPVPVILCGKAEVIGKSVIAALLPEFEVIRFILTLEAGIAEIPSLLSGRSLVKSENIGSQNYSKTAAAVITGRGYDAEAVEKMREACKGIGNGVPWLIPDMSIPTPPRGPAYGKALVERIKVLIKELEESGEMGGDGVYFY